MAIGRCWRLALLFAMWMGAFLPVDAAEHILHSFHKLHLTPVFYSEGAHFGDFNRDGAMDVVSGPFWYAGPDFKQAHEYYEPRPYDKKGYSDNFFAFTDDINDDGWTDILIVGFPGKQAYWFENPQGESGHWPRHEAFDIVDNESPTFVDLTGDGKKELVFHTRGQFGWAGPDASDPTKPWEFHRISPAGDYQRFTHGLGVGDVNGDGRRDILEKSGWFEQPANAAASDALWTRHDFAFSGPGGAQMYAYDFDGDGDNDVLTSLWAHGYGLAWYENTRRGGQIEFKRHLIMGETPAENRYGLAFSQLHAVDLIDMDGDGLLDIVTGKRHWAHGGKDPGGDQPAVLYWFQTVRTEDGVDFVPHQIDSDSGVGTQVVCGDVTGDGLADVVVGNKLGTFLHIHEAREVSEQEWREAQPQPREAAASDEATSPDSKAVGELPRGKSGHALNLDFETGTLEDWVVDGDAFAGQPIRGDTVARRRADMQSQHAGEYWVGTFEVAGDKPRGTLTSAPFVVSQPFASFLVAGGRWPTTRVELVAADSDEPLFTASGEETENMARVVVNLSKYQGAEIRIRLVDNSSRGWGHINFDDFRLHARRPTFPNERRIEPLDEYANAGLLPEEAAAAMTVPEGFRVTCFAGEPDVHQPIAMALDDRGRLWVAEAYSYPQRLPDDEARDRIVIFEDRDGDGRFDEQTVFADDLNLVSGLEVGFGGVWVGAAPHLLFIPDRDYDDRPDGPPEVLLDGWGYHDTHETLNSFIWGPDGWLYGCHGVFTHSEVGKPGTPKEERVPINAGIWRYHPTEHRFEVYAHGTSNPWGVDFDDHGEAFLTCCVIPHLFHVVQGARYHRQAGQHFNAHTYDDIKTIARHRHWIGATPHAGNNRSDSAGGGHAHCGAMIYLGGAWPDAYRNQMFMNNIHGNRLNVDRLWQERSGYVGDRAPDFLLANDSWSQIINMRYGPDGNVYMIDWYDKNACHRPQREVHDRTNGRIFKIAYGETQSTTIDLRQLSDAELVALETHENDWYVRHARRILQERGGNAEVHTALTELAFGDAEPIQRLRGLWALHVTGGLTPELVRRGLGDEVPHVRAWTIQLALESGEPSSELLAQLGALARDDASPVVRLYLASAAQRVGVERSILLLAGLLAHDEDAGDHNLPLMYWYALEPVAAADPERALALVRECAIPPLLEYTVRRVAELGTPESLAVLVEALLETREQPRQVVILDALDRALAGRRRIDMPAAWPDAFRQLSASASADVQARLTALAVKFGDPAALVALLELVGNRDADVALRRSALAALVGAKAKGLPPLLGELLEEPALRGEAIRALAAYQDAQTPDWILAIYAELTPSEKRDALNTLAARRPWALRLLAAVGDERVPSRDLTADVIRQLRQHKSEEIDELIVAVWGTVQETSADAAETIAKYRELLETTPTTEPDLALGRAVYAKTCAQCHRLFAAGGDIGPELTGSNRANLEYVLTNVLDPSALIGKDYVAHSIVTDDGRVLTGIIRRETDDALEIATANETIVLPRDEVDEVAPSTKSMMPDDLVRTLSEHELRSLVAYLAAPAQVPMLATVDNVAGLFNGRDLTGWQGDLDLWSVEDGAIVGRTEGIDHNSFLTSDLSVEDFRLQVEVLLVDNRGNSGIQFRSRATDDGGVAGYQADIGPGWWGKLYEEHGRGLLWDRSGADLVRPGEWNTYEIVAVGSSIRTYINGKQAVDVDDSQGARRGILALQLHSGGATEVRFRNFRLELETADALADLPGGE